MFREYETASALIGLLLFAGHNGDSGKKPLLVIYGGGFCPKKN